MSISQIAVRGSTVLTLLQHVSKSESATTASMGSNDIIKTAYGISAAPGGAAKQASGAAFTFTVSQSLKDEAHKADASGSIIMAGIGGGEAVERFDSWEALEARIRTDQTMDAKQKSHWLDQASSLKESIVDLKKYQQSNLYLGMKSGAFQAAQDAAVQAYLAESTSVVDLQGSLEGSRMETFLREVGA